MKIDFTPLPDTASGAYIPLAPKGLGKMPSKIDFTPIPDNVPSAPQFSTPKPTVMQDIVGGLSQAGSDTLHDLSSLGSKAANALDVLAPLGNIAQPTARAVAHHVGNPNDWTYKGADIIGNTLPFLGGGEGLEAIRAGAEGIPFVGKVASSLTGDGLRGVTRRAIGSSLYGAVTNPNHRLSGAEFGAIASPVADLVPGAVAGGKKGIKMLAKAIDPKYVVKDILKDIGGGQTREDAGKSVAKAVKRAYTNAREIGNAYYNRLNNHLSSLPSKRFGLDNLSDISEESKDSLNSDPHLKKFYESLLEEPNFENARNLDIQLGSAKNAFPSGHVADLATGLHVKHLNIAEDALQKDISNYLDNKGGQAKDLFTAAQKNWKENVIPYHDPKKPQIFKMAKGKLTNPVNIHNIFKSPEVETLKVLNDLPDSAKDNLMYSVLGKENLKSKPDKFLSNYKNALNDGLGSSITPKLSRHLENLDNVINRQDNINKSVGGILGAIVGAHVGDTELAPALGGVMGQFIGKPIKDTIETALFSRPVTLAARGAAKAYPYAAKTALANIIRGNNS